MQHTVMYPAYKPEDLFTSSKQQQTYQMAFSTAAKHSEMFIQRENCGDGRMSAGGFASDAQLQSSLHMEVDDCQTRYSMHDRENKTKSNRLTQTTYQQFVSAKTQWKTAQTKAVRSDTHCGCGRTDLGLLNQILELLAAKGLHPVGLLAINGVATKDLIIEQTLMTSVGVHVKT